MCTLVILRRPETRWPLIIGANRDELSTRPWKAPARHWPDRPEVVAGKDMTAGGSWFGVNDDGLFAAILNRPGTLGPETGKRSRGELVLEALDHAEAKVAAEALAELNPESYRPFNLVVADRYDAFWLRHAGNTSSLRIRTPSGAWREIDPVHMPAASSSFGKTGALVQMVTDTAGLESEIVAQPIPSGLSMITAHDLNDPASPLITHYLPRFQATKTPDPRTDDWEGWIEILGDRDAPTADPKTAINVTKAGAFTTVCSHLLALPAIGEPVMRFAAGRPDEAPFERVDLA
jgi:hypothetical protein